MNLPQKVTLCEVGLRDGLQNEAAVLNTREKLELARMAMDAGFPVIELGSFMSPKAVPQLADTDKLYKELGAAGALDANSKTPELRALIANEKGVQRAAACGCKKVKLNVSASRAHNLANLNRTPEESVAGFAGVAAAAKQAGIALSGSISMPFASPWEAAIPAADVFTIIDAYLALGITELSLSDTSGMGAPTQVYALCTEVQAKYPQATWWMHFHNTRGLGLANMLAAMQAGITRFDSSFGGLGGCPFVPGAAGNIATEDVVHMLDKMDIETGVCLKTALALAKRATELVGHPGNSYLLRTGG